MTQCTHRRVGDRCRGSLRKARGALLCLALLLAAQPAFAERTDSLSAEVAYERGARALRAGDTEAALEYLARSNELEPESTQILSLYGRALLIAGRPAEAMALFDKFADLNPQSTEIDYYRGIASYQLGNWSKTIVYLRPEIGKRPEEGMIRLYMGIAYQETGRPGKAKKMLKEAAQVDPTLRAAALYRLGVMALEQKNISEAKEFLGEVEQIAAGSVLARSARNYLDQLDSGLYRPVAAYATFAGGYDSNVSQATDEELAVTAEPGIQSGVGQGTFGVSGLILDTNLLDLRLGANGFASIHGSNPANNYDLALTRGFLIGSVEITEKVRFNLGYTYEYMWLNYEKYRSTNDVDVSLRFVPFRNFVTNITYEAQIRDVLLPPATAALNQDATVQTAGISQLWYTPDWFGFGKNFLGAGFQFRHEKSDGLEYDSNTYVASFRTGFALPWSMYWTTSAGYEWRMFEHASCFYAYPAKPLCDPPPVSGYPKRQDKTVRVFSNLRISISQAVYFDLSYRYSKRMSNVHYYRYDRNVVEFGATYRY